MADCGSLQMILITFHRDVTVAAPHLQSGGKYDLKMLILTCGVNGSYVFTPGRVYFQETPKVEVADTVGAGDSFTAAFVSAILKGAPVEDAHRLAVCTSAYVCTQNGAMPLLPAELIEM